MKKETLHLLILEDNPADAELAVRELEKERFVVEWSLVETEEDFRKALSKNPDLILVDYVVPSFSGSDALKVHNEIVPEIPLIIISGKIGEEIAVECMKLGAVDYVLKDKLFRLGPVVKRALQEAEELRERKRAEEKIEKLQSLRNTISNINQLLVRTKSESELFQQTCNLLVKVKDIKFAWIGLTDRENFKVKPVAQAGFEKGYLSSIKVTWDDSKYGQGPTGIALKTSQPFIMRNIEHDPKFKPWKNDALKRGYLSSIALPLIHEEETIGALNVYSGTKDAFADEEVRFLKEVAEDITIGIRSLRLELKLQQSYKKLQKTMEGTINVIAKIIEAKDPYTAGHQQKVSKLATSIAWEMKLSEDKIEGIRIASLVHDIGKISIPAEILSKPTKLNEIEYSLIKDHSQIGYDILKSIEFPWPVAQIILQHHERIDGSGYPQGLKGNDILLEARIMGVADVVEAMSSHRPYRPALGIDKALEEISQNKGILYDLKVVDICLKLFREKGFKFEL